MAEGDTVLRIARRIDEALAGESVGATAFDPRGGLAARRLDGSRLERARAHGKHLLLDFGEVVLHSHLGMSGSWQLHPIGAAWGKPKSSAWLVLRGRAVEAVQFGGPTLRLLRGGSVRRDPVLGRLGPDILASDFDLSALTARFRSHGDREIGDALLDQGLLAGIGNIFKSEACFAARVNPWQPISELTPDEIDRVLASARSLMLEAVASGRHPHAVYRKAGQPCPRCGSRLASRGQGDANRTTYWCPRCQDAPQAPSSAL